MTQKNRFWRQLVAGTDFLISLSGNFNLTCLVAETRSQSQKSAYKDLGRNGLSPGHHAQGHLYSDF
ncbi:hypothetical protein F9B82_10775 [Lacticaseibacillus casei]|nr:hypothetical protein F9B82_10775 [Lacticaseibacillus casei]